MLHSIVPLFASLAASLTPGPDFVGRCDASAVRLVGDALVLVADDEKNSLALYPVSGGQRTHKIGVKDFLEQSGSGDGEADLEGVAQRGETLWFIGSHSRNGAGELQPDRQVLFGLQPDPARPGAEPAFVGKPIRGLLAAMSALDGVGPLIAAAANRAPMDTAGGLSIEGLAATEDGLWVGLRNPLVDGKAILVHVAQPEAAAGGAALALTSTTLDLGGRGVRAMHPFSGGYLIVAGAVDDVRSFTLFHWDQAAASAGLRELDVDWGTLTPEAITVGDDGRALVLSDDGRRELTYEADGATVTERCKDAPKEQRRFRSAWLELDAVDGAGATAPEPVRPQSP